MVVFHLGLASGFVFAIIVIWI